MILSNCLIFFCLLSSGRMEFLCGSDLSSAVFELKRCPLPRRNTKSIVSHIVFTLHLLKLRNIVTFRFETPHGHTLWCAIGVGTWWAPYLPYNRRDMWGSCYGYPAKKIFLGPLLDLKALLSLCLFLFFHLE